MVTNTFGFYYKKALLALLAKGKKRLFEATGDKAWAYGFPLTKIHELTLPTPGKNCTGESVERKRGGVRDGALTVTLTSDELRLKWLS